MNALERQLEVLAEQWRRFAATDGRAFLWRGPSEARAVLETFLAVQAEDIPAGAERPPGYLTLDALFVTLDEPFKTRDAYAKALVARLQAEVADAVQAGIVDKPWQPPPPARDDPVAWFAGTCAALVRFLGVEQLAIALLPPALTDELARDWSQVVAEVLAAGLPGSVRIVVFDDAAHPCLTKLDGLAKVVTVDAPGQDHELLRRLVREAGGSGHGVHFRNLLVDASIAAGAGWSKEFDDLSRQAFSVAEEQGWTEQMFTVAMLRGGVRLAASGDKRVDASERAAAVERSRAEYRNAQGFAETLRELDPEPSARAPMGKGATLAYQGLLGEAAALLVLAHSQASDRDTAASTSFEAAAECYRRAAALALLPARGNGRGDTPAESEVDPAARRALAAQVARLRLEALRMEAYCLGKILDTAPSRKDIWQRACVACMEGARAGRRVPRDERKDTTLAHLGIAHLGLCDSRGRFLSARESPCARDRPMVELRMRRLFGTDKWQDFSALRRSS